MKPLSEVRYNIAIIPEPINLGYKYLQDCLQENRVDFDVYLPSKGFNLQRECVWNIDQKRELIWSIFKKRNIPRIAVLHTCDEVYQIIDGKQRLTTVFEFLDDKFTIVDELGNEYLYSQLSQEYKRALITDNIAGVIAYEWESNIYTDDEKIEWFEFINFAGTEMDAKHLNKLKNS